MSYFLNGTGRLCASARNPPEMGGSGLGRFREEPRRWRAELVAKFAPDTGL
jgi:hypothetical protein